MLSPPIAESEERQTRHREMVVSVSGIGEKRHTRHWEMVVLSSPVFESVERRTHHWMMVLSYSLYKIYPSQFYFLSLDLEGHYPR